MKTVIKTLNAFSKGEIILWLSSVAVIVVAFLLFDRENYIALSASVIGVTSLIFNAKGNPFGQVLMIIFSILYGIISFSFSYYGEMVTYLGMTLPMAVIALISWLKNPYKGNHSQVTINKISRKEWIFMLCLSLVVTVAFYFILKAFGTANLILSTISITTSFIAAYLTFRRSEYFPLFYASNDVVLIVLWVWATLQNTTYLCVVICFVAFLVNDLYGFISWKRMYISQNNKGGR